MKSKIMDVDQLLSYHWIGHRISFIIRVGLTFIVEGLRIFSKKCEFSTKIPHFDMPISMSISMGTEGCFLRKKNVRCHRNTWTVYIMNIDAIGYSQIWENYWIINLKSHGLRQLRWMLRQLRCISTIKKILRMVDNILLVSLSSITS